MRPRYTTPYAPLPKGYINVLIYFLLEFVKLFNVLFSRFDEEIFLKDKFGLRFHFIISNLLINSLIKNLEFIFVK
jgi:hypothetical protein